MAEAYELRNMVEDEQAEFAELLRSLTPEQWEQPSLCAGWSIHEAVVHIAIHSHTSGAERVKDGLRYIRGNDPKIPAARARSREDLVTWLESPATLGTSRFDILTQLSELVIHQQDVRRGVGIDRKIPAERLGVVLDFGLAASAFTWTMAFSRKRAKGLRLVAPDVGWWSGSGPEVRGPGEAILMALNGRPGAVEELSGQGVPVLASRIKA